VAVEQSKARCTVAEDERLVAFGMQTSRLDEHHTVVDLMSRGVNKQPLRNAVGNGKTAGTDRARASCCIVR
jgi:Arc/MetJ family transcription regulator